LKKPRLLIIADDLTGANDAGVQFAKRGIRSIVFAGPEAAEFPEGYAAVVVNTESRHVTPSEAVARVRRVAEAGLRHGITHIFKKTDSTLRGNIGAELKALSEATGARTVPFVPAFPEMGRTTRGGIHYVDSVPIALTAFANDPLSPVRESEVLKVLKRTAELQVANATLANYSEQIRAECVVLDCASREELRAIATFFRDRGELRILSGSAAFAEELPNVLELPVAAFEKVEARRPILFVNGSMNPRAFEQVAALKNEVHIVRLQPDDLFVRQSTSVLKSIPANADALICTLQSRDDFPAFEQRARELGVADSHQAVAKAVGTLVQECVRKGGFNTLVIFGGDTLMGITKAMNWNAFIPQTEIEPGISVSKPSGRDLVVISKAGGFGDRDAARRILAWVRESSNSA
jgi:D-threonate/D-erythronate kinase